MMRTRTMHGLVHGSADGAITDPHFITISEQ
jgi:hypothetical protein